MLAGESPAPVPKNSSKAGAKSPVESPCRYRAAVGPPLPSGSGACRAAGDDATEPLPLSGSLVHSPLVDPRSPKLDRAGPANYLALVVVAIPYHQSMSRMLVALCFGGFEVSIDLGLEGGSEHPLGSLSDDLVQIEQEELLSQGD
jgi:hypothetical protein